ncbi:unnamed protein product [Dibothriocephalus latus]|uniref:F-BAR domain-containing protein n=1 Tax=Dibothriocephalus latus TaxID=60516 RepID=A0A3P7LYY7_DIBLA|nr:unnamed protein product [Dibothriocephalus latus]
MLQLRYKLPEQCETLLRHETDQSSLNDQYLRFLSEVQKTVLDFSKRYRKLVSNFNPKSKSSDELTYNACLLESLKPLQDTGAAFEQYANDLLKSVIEPMKKAIEKDKKQIDKVSADYAKLLSKREHERRKLDDTWKAHVLALKEKQKYQQLNTQAQQDMTLSREELKKSESAYNGKVKAFKDSQQTYAADMTKYNSFQRHFYAHHIYNVISELESLDSQRAAGNKTLLRTCANLGQSMAKQVEEANSSFAACVEKIDPDKVSSFAAYSAYFYSAVTVASVHLMLGVLSNIMSSSVAKAPALLFFFKPILTFLASGVVVKCAFSLLCQARAYSHPLLRILVFCSTTLLSCKL